MAPTTTTGKPTITMEEIALLGSRGNAQRRLTKEAMEFYGVKARYGADGEINRFFFPIVEASATEITGYKTKNPKDKASQFSVGSVSGIFGLEHFRSGGKKLVITEGEEDTIAVQVANLTRWGRTFPVVSMGSSSQTDFLLNDRETLLKFDEILLWLDNDEEGQKAVAKAAKILGFERVKLVSSEQKDANATLMLGDGLKDGVNKVLDALFAPKPYNPSGLLSGEDLWAELVKYDEVKSQPYPAMMEGLNEKLQGMRLGEITLLTSGSGTGKSSIVREMAWNLKTATEEKIGIVALEESPGETTRKLSGLALNRNPAEESIPLEELRTGFDQVFADGRIVVLDHAGAATDSRVIDLVEFMCASGVKYIFIDHLTIMISEGVEGKDGLEAQDKVMNDLLRLVKRYNVWIGLVSHLRKTSGRAQSFEEGGMPSMDDIRGSGSTKQIAMDIIAFARNTVAFDEREKNTISFRVLKCRHTGLTGNAGEMIYHRPTGRLQKAPASSDTEFMLVNGVLQESTTP
jgi:twinkle protein